MRPFSLGKPVGFVPKAKATDVYLKFTTDITGVKCYIVDLNGGDWVTWNGSEWVDFHTYPTPPDCDYLGNSSDPGGVWFYVMPPTLPDDSDGTVLVWFIADPDLAQPDGDVYYCLEMSKAKSNVIGMG